MIKLKYKGLCVETTQKILRTFNFVFHFNQIIVNIETNKTIFFSTEYQGCVYFVHISASEISMNNNSYNIVMYSHDDNHDISYIHSKCEEAFKILGYKDVTTKKIANF